MSDYRRLISYIYAYEGGVKGKNIGFAKIEVRGEQCRIYVSVKRVYVGSNDIGVYLLSPSDEILLGRIFVRGGIGEFRMNVNSSNIEGSGCAMEACYGLTIHDVESTWQCYTTIWEDAVTQAAETTLADVTSENIRKQDANPSQLSISEEIERELDAEEEKIEAMAPWTGEHEEEVRGEPKNPGAEEAEKKPGAAALEKESETTVIVTESVEEEAVIPETVAAEAVASEPEKPETVASETVKPETVILENVIGETVTSEAVQLETVTVQTSPSDSVFPPEPEDTAKLQELDRQEQEERLRNHLWNRLQRRYTKVLAFDYDNGCEILSIKPQDIGLLPRDIWVYGNNSFLLHGYYNYRHLILARLNNPKGEPRYLLGVPGHYFSNEKYMAAMFGFPHFVLARRQPEHDGRFGYWYTDIRLQ